MSPQHPAAGASKGVADLTDPTARAFWKQVFEAADHAFELEPTERREFVERCRRDQPALATELEALIERDEAGSALETPAAAFAAPLLDLSEPTAPGLTAGAIQFGPYRVLRELGHGGMGAVYLAERADDQYRKQVALKVFPPWSGGDPRRVQRFIDERQILAALDHPDIARLVDGGVTDDGLPWFAMEYIDGVPIDQYCDSQRLSIDDRLKLFARVCSAVQYAHRNLVVHRDLKPSNIFVAAGGRVALLDFGIAKLLDDGEVPALQAETLTIDRVLTPMYASPEQIRGERVTTASDVYTLGVLLYVLLTGSGPYRLSTRQSYEIASAVLEQEPDRPSVAVERTAVATAHATARRTTSSKLVRRLRDDLDAVVLKALEKNASRRYASAEQLEDDVRRHLDGRPVLARAAGRLYHTRKFVRRHRLGVGIAASITVLVLAFATVMTVQRSQIRAQAERIALERDRAQQGSQYLMSLFRRIDPASTQVGVTALEILDDAAARINRPGFQQPEQRAAVMFEMAQAYHRLNFQERALALVDSSLAVRRSFQPKPVLEIARNLQLRGSVLMAQREFGAAEQAYTEALALRRQASGPRDGDVARSLVGLATALRAQRRLPDAERVAREALAIDERRTGDVRADVAESKSALAEIRLARGDHPGSALLYGQALALLRGKHPEEHVEVARAVLGLAAALRSGGNERLADSLVTYGLGLQQRLVLASAFMGRSETPLLPTAAGAAAASPAAPPAGATAIPSAVETSTATGGDNSLIAFVSDRDGPDPTGHAGNSEIYVMNPDGSNQRRLTRGESPDDNPAWSPDGRRIAFSSMQDGQVQIALMDANGTNQRRLTESGVGFRRPAWSPDGRRIAMQSVVRPDIYVANVDGTRLTNITNHPARDGNAAWLPDGRRIAFNSDRDGNSEIYLMDPDGRNVVRLTLNDAADQRPEWSPDGRRIAFSSSRDGDSEIYVMNADGSNPVRITFNAGEDGHPTWSPDGSRIAFHRRVLGHTQIFVMNADGSDVKRLTDISPVAFSAFPRWGPARRK